MRGQLEHPPRTARTRHFQNHVSAIFSLSAARGPGPAVDMFVAPAALCAALGRCCKQRRQRPGATATSAAGCGSVRVRLQIEHCASLRKWLVKALSSQHQCELEVAHDDCLERRNVTIPFHPVAELSAKVARIQSSPNIQPAAQIQTAVSAVCFWPAHVENKRLVAAALSCAVVKRRDRKISNTSCSTC